MRQILAAAAAALLLVGCASSPRITSDHDTSVDFGAYRTYGWAYGDTPQGGDAVLRQRVKVSIDQALTARGFTPSANPDFTVGYTLGSRDRVEVNDLGAYGPYYPRYGSSFRGGWARTYTPVEVRNVTDGTLTVDIYDAKNKRPIWNGRAEKEISSKTPDQALVQQAVDGVLARFPPKPAS